MGQRAARKAVAGHFRAPGEQAGRGPTPRSGRGPEECWALKRGRTDGVAGVGGGGGSSRQASCSQGQHQNEDGGEGRHTDTHKHMHSNDTLRHGWTGAHGRAERRGVARKQGQTSVSAAIKWRYCYSHGAAQTCSAACRGALCRGPQPEVAPSAAAAGWGWGWGTSRAGRPGGGRVGSLGGQPVRPQGLGAGRRKQLGC